MRYKLKGMSPDFKKTHVTYFTVVAKNDKVVTCQSQSGAKYNLPRAGFDDLLKKGTIKPA